MIPIVGEENRTRLGVAEHDDQGQPAPAAPAKVDAEAVGAPQTSYLPPVDDPLVGAKLVDRYLIDRKLGEGGMGAVYLATHTLLEKQVALKVLHGEFARKQDLVDRFMQEAKAASRIRQENVIDISDFGVTPDGLVFFAMELLNGHDLYTELAKQREVTGAGLPWVRGRSIFLQICAALIAAHAKGIVHRDLKPENIYLVDFLGQPDFVKLLDFGIAKLTDVGDGDRKLTKTGMLFGTPEYMAPEQARGEKADHRVDIYAMGCILFQLITGRVPFEADNFMGVLTLHLVQPPPELTAGQLGQVGAPLEVAAVVAKALAKDRELRYQTIVDLANAVRATAGEAPLPHPTEFVHAAPLTAPLATVASAAVAKPRAWLMPAVGAVVLLGAVGGWLATRGPRATVAAPPTLSAPAAAVATPAQPASPLAPVAAPAAANVTLTFTTSPAGASIRRADSPTLLGTTPFSIDVALEKVERTYVAELAGYGAVELRATPDAPRLLSGTLQATAKPKPRTTPKRGNVPNPEGTPKPLPDDSDEPVLKASPFAPTP